MALYHVFVLKVILGHTTYLLQLWLMKPYPDINDPAKRELSFKLSSCHMLMEYPFVWLKARWSCLDTQLDANVANAISIIVACCVLHIICDIKGENFRTE